jgi:hypothetical protein
MTDWRIIRVSLSPPPVSFPSSSGYRPAQCADRLGQGYYVSFPSLSGARPARISCERQQEADVSFPTSSGDQPAQCLGKVPVVSVFHSLLHQGISQNRWPQIVLQAQSLAKGDSKKYFVSIVDVKMPAFVPRWFGKR